MSRVWLIRWWRVITDHSLYDRRCDKGYDSVVGFRAATLFFVSLFDYAIFVAIL